jgi:hypothetical protein
MRYFERQDGQAVAFPVSDLTRLLLRRATGPIGVIDVRHPQELHSRSNLWLGQRLELLNNLKNRYGLDQDSGDTAGITSPVAGGMSFIAPLQRMAATSPFDLASVSPLINHTGMPETVGATVAKASSAPSTLQYRVKRLNTQMDPSFSKPLSSEMVTTQWPAAGEIRASTHSIPAMHLQRRTGETLSPVSSEPEASPQSSAGTSKPEASALPFVRAAAVDTAQYVDTKLVPRQEGSLMGGLLPRVSELPRIAIAAPVHLQRMPDSLAVAEESGRFSTPHHFSPASTLEDLSGDDAPPLSRPASGGLYLRRNVDHPAAFPEANPVQTAETVTTLDAVSAETRVATALPGSTNIVWRKADTNGTSRENATPSPALAVGPTYMNQPQVMREAASEPVSSGGSVAPVPTPISGNSGADVMRIAERVSRIIARQLRVESERRGRSR